MRPRADILALLDRLDGEPADAIESETLDCKRWDAKSSRKEQIRKLCEAVICFANAQGGTILLGIDDGKSSRAEAIHGVGDLDPEALRVSIFEGTEPPVLVEVQSLDLPEGRVLAVRVPEGIPPYSTTAGVTKIRIGKQCMPLTGEALRRVLTERRPQDVTAALHPDARLADLDPVALERARDLLQTEGRATRTWTDEALLDHLDLRSAGQLRQAAILLFGRKERMRDLLPEHELVAIRIVEGTKYDHRIDSREPLLLLLDRMATWFEDMIPFRLVQTSFLQEMTIPGLSSVIAREVLLNALVHRDWRLHQSVQVRIEEGMVRVSNPGSFIGGIRPENLLRHDPERRNPLLAGAVQVLGLVNRAGLGVDRIYEEMLRAGKGFPRYQDDSGRITIMLPIHTHEPLARFVAEENHEGRRLELDDLILLRAMVEQGSLDRWSAARVLQLDETAAAEALIRLRERSWFLPAGRGGGTRYRLEPSLFDRIRGTTQTNLDLPLDHESVLLRVSSVLEARKTITNAQVRDMTGWSRAKVRRLMDELRNQGKVQSRGKGRGAWWEWVGGA